MDLYPSPQDTTPIASVPIGFARFAEGQPLTVNLPIQADSAGKTYYVELSAPGGIVQVMGRDEDVYPGGNASQNGEALEADAAFQLYYQYDWQAALADALSMVRGAGPLLPLGVMLVVPGYLILDLLGIGKGLGGLERPALYLGTSLAAIPVAMTCTSLAGLRWGSTSLWLTAGVLCALAVWRLYPWLRRPRVNISGVGWAMTGVLLATLFLRMAMVRDLSAPPQICHRFETFLMTLYREVSKRSILHDSSEPDETTEKLPNPFLGT